MVRSSLFREDLYYRLDVFTIRIPPLRDRVEDIAPLVDHFLPRIRKYINSNVTEVSGEVLNFFLGYSWPGNVRELQNVIEGAMNLCTGHTIILEDLNVRIKRELSHANSIAPKGETSALKGTNLKTLERGMILKVLHVNNGNKRRAAQHLGIPRSTLYNKMKRYAINV